MSLLDDFARVSKRRPCPVCGRSGWCLVARDSLEDPSRAVCARVESNKRWGHAGWLHVLRDNGIRPRSRSMSMSLATPVMAELAEKFCGRADAVQVAALSATLGVSQFSLRRLEIGWTGAAWSFPMRTANGRVCGIRLRFPCGAKRCVTGSREGLFIPSGASSSGTLFICEGPTDTAAMLSLGLHAIGRPSCTGGVREVSRFVSANRHESLVIAADRDQPGRDGAEVLARAIQGAAPSLRIVCPPGGCKDMRAWVQAGATRADVDAAVQAQATLKARLVRRPR